MELGTYGTLYAVRSIGSDDETYAFLAVDDTGNHILDLEFDYQYDVEDTDYYDTLFDRSGIEYSCMYDKSQGFYPTDAYEVIAENMVDNGWDPDLFSWS